MRDSSGTTDGTTRDMAGRVIARGEPAVRVATVERPDTLRLTFDSERDAMYVAARVRRYLGGTYGAEVCGPKGAWQIRLTSHLGTPGQLLLDKMTFFALGIVTTYAKLEGGWR